jgi:hypothetical protein
VSRGHNENKIIYEYSLNKVIEYYKAGMINNADTVKKIAIAIRLAYHADEQEFNSFIKPSNEEKPISSDGVAQLMKLQGAKNGN